MIADKKVITIQQIATFLEKVDKDFPIPLSQKQSLSGLAEKFFNCATLSIVLQDNEIVSMVAGYTNDVVSKIAYISIVATTVGGRGKGYAKHLVQEFISVAKDKEYKAVHLYAVPTNTVAVNMYKKMGFEEWVIPNEQRPDDLHLIYYINKDNRE